MRPRSLPRRIAFLLLPLGVACGGSGDADEPVDDGSGAGASAGSSGASGASAGGKAGSSTGGAAGKGGSGITGGAAGASGAGAGGASGTGGAGASGAAGKAGSGGGGTGGAGTGGAGTGGAGKGGASGAAGTAGTAGAAGTAGKGGSAGAGGAPCVDTCKKGVCIGETCCDLAHACGSVCCASADVCSFGKCVTPGSTCTDETDCPPDDYCELSLGSGAAGAAGAGGAAGSAGAGGAGKGGSAGSAGTGGAGAGGAAGASGAAGAGAACVSGNQPPKGKCLPKPPKCSSGGGGAAGASGNAGAAGASGNPGAPTCVESCEVKPATPSFDPVLKYAWGGQTTSPTASDVMMTPIVVQLDDDNCDGKVNENDIPEIVFSTFSGGAYYKQGTLHAISIVGGKVVDKWSAPNMTQPGGQLAAGDLDGDGVPEIIACANPGPSGASCCDALATNTGVVAFRANGTVLWTQPDTTKVHCGYEAPAIGDVDQDGFPEVLVGLTLLDGKTGAVKKELDPATGSGARLTGLADLDGDGKLDIVDGQRAFRADGTVLWDLRTGPDAVPFGYHAVGDLDKDGKPEVVILSSSGPHTASVIQYDKTSASGAKVVRKALDLNNGISTKTFCGSASEYGGGPPTIADFDGDGYPDIGGASAVGYVVFSGKKLMDAAVPNASTVLWFKPTHDCSSAVTGSSVFDFNGDGKAEVVYSDEYHLWMYDGQTGNNLIPSTCNTTGTLWEYPVVADVDADGHADIVVASNAYGITCPDNASKQSGIRVFGSAAGSWVRTRRVWNQHTYHVTNVGEDGRIPQKELANWKVAGLNDYRQNKQPGAEFAAPDAIVSAAGPICDANYGLYATVTNIGESVLPPDVPVAFYKGALPPGGTLLGTTKTTLSLYPAQSQTVSIATSDAQIKAGTESFYVVFDPGNGPHPAWAECKLGNDTFGPASGVCKQ